MMDKAKRAWERLAGFREMRRRCKRYTYGRQWDDMIDVDGVRMTEYDYLRRQGSVPMKNNLIRKMVRSVLGVYRNNYEFPSAESLGLDPKRAADRERYRRLREFAAAECLDELFARLLEEFLIGGMAILRVTPLMEDGSGERTGGSMRCVAPDRFFVDAASRDFRGRDATLVGEIHDLDFESLAGRFARSRKDVEHLRALYRDGSPRGCRVVECWQLDSRARYRVHDPAAGTLFTMEERDYGRLPAAERRRLEAQWFVDRVWRYAFLAPDGTVLRSGDSPLPGGGHPYVWKAYPFIDGEIHSFVDDIIDQQRFTNRLITMYDWLLRSSAKGVLLFPEEAVPYGADMQEIVDEWSKFNGVITYRSKGGVAAPHQVSSQGAHSGISDLLNIQLRMFEDVSGVNAALQGKLESGSTSGALYDRQTQQSLTTLADLLKTYEFFVREAVVRL